MLFSHQVVIFSKVNPVYLFKRLWMSERSYLCSAQPGHALQGSTDRWRQQVPSFTLVEASKPWDWPRSPRQEAALGRATRPSTFYTPSTLGTRTWATRAEQARPSPLTLRTGVRYSATSRAFPFTVLITFCILGLEQRWVTEGLSQFGPQGSQKLPRTCPTGIEPRSGTGPAGGEGVGGRGGDTRRPGPAVTWPPPPQRAQAS